MAFAMFSTAMRMKPSAISSPVRPSPISLASAANFALTPSASSRSAPLSPKIAGKCRGISLPTMTLASVTASGPPLR